MEKTRTSLFARVLAAFMALAVAFAFAGLVGCSACSAPGGGGSVAQQQRQQPSASAESPQAQGKNVALAVDEDGAYTSKDEVALYIHLYGHLPGNYISKTKAKKAGWVPSKGNLPAVCPGKSIGGSIFYNDDGLLPDEDGRTWHECDIDYAGGTRNAKRIVFSDDGLVYYTGDHYKTFERLY